MRTSRMMRLVLTTVLSALGNVGLPQTPFALDTNFRTIIPEVYVSSLHPLDDGRLLVAGNFRHPESQTLLGLGRLSLDGSWDLSFDASNRGSGRIKPWNDRFYVANTQTVQRILYDGDDDEDFIHMNLGPYFSSLQGGDYHVFPDGRVLMSGAHILSDTERGFEGLYSLIWFSNEGYLDTTRIHRYCDNVIYEIEQQPDGKFLCSGTMNSFEDEAVKRIFRVEADGSLDPSFQAGIEQWGVAFEFEFLDDGRILAGGSFKAVGSEDTLSLIRLMPDGALDPSFNLLYFKKSYRPDALNLVTGIMGLGDGRMVITGGFDRIDGNVRGCVAMLDIDGNLLDDAFTGTGCDTLLTATGITKSVRNIVAAPNGSYYIFGGYSGYDDGTTNDTEQRMVSRLYGLDVGVRERSVAQMAVYPNPTYTQLTVDLELAVAHGLLILKDAMGREVLRQSATGHYTLLDVSRLAAGVYTLELRGNDRRLAIERVVVQH